MSNATADRGHTACDDVCAYSGGAEADKYYSHKGISEKCVAKVAEHSYKRYQEAEREARSSATIIKSSSRTGEGSVMPRN